MAQNDIINVILFGKEIGRIGQYDHKKKTSFQYNPDFLGENIYKNVFPKTGIIRRTPNPQVFSKYNNPTFKGLPPQIADSLPDMFGNLIFRTWLEANQRKQKEVSVIEQLAYISNRGMGALEYAPSKKLPKKVTIDLHEIIEILKSVLDEKKNAQGNNLDTQALLNIFKIGTSAGGARPKILISEHKKTGRIIPGDLEYSNQFDHYLVKLSIDEDLGYSREVIEYCYYLAARKVNIQIMDSKLIDNEHFATLRFDRQDGQKRHCLTATGITGWDFKDPTHSSYENLFSLASFLNISHSQIEELYKRMIFNVVFYNTDDHLKNHSFIYDKENDHWSLSPAYDITYALNPLIAYKKSNRALSINHKRYNITLADVLKIADDFTIKNPKGIIEEVQETVPFWEEQMHHHEIPVHIIQKIKADFNLILN